MKAFWLFPTFMFFSSCMVSNGLQYEAMSETNQYRIARIRKGMSEKQVLQVMHKPYSYESFQFDDDIYDVWFYVTTATGLDQTRMVPQNLTPLTFKNGVLVGTGYSWYYYAMKGEADEVAAHAPKPIPQPKAPEVEDKAFEKVLKAPSKNSPTHKAPAQEKLPPNVHIISVGEKATCPTCSYDMSTSESSCGACPNTDCRAYRFDQLMNGMSEVRVLTAVGEPMKQECFEIGIDVYDVWFYDTIPSKTGKPSKIPQAQTILTFKNAVLISKNDEEFFRLKEQARAQLAVIETEETEKSAPKKRFSLFKTYVPSAPLGMISAKTFSQVKRGMSEAEVQKMLGPTDRQEAYKVGKNKYSVWFYTVKQINRSKVKTPLTFKNGILIGITEEEYKKYKDREGEEEIHSYGKSDERMQEEESEQNFDYW